jgi:hypothetical protein
MMYLTVRRYEGVTNVGEVARHVNEGFLPIIAEVPGFVAYYLVDAGGDVIESTSVFEDEAGEKESDRRAKDLSKRTWLPCFRTRPRSQRVTLSRKGDRKAESWTRQRELSRG